MKKASFLSLFGLLVLLSLLLTVDLFAQETTIREPDKTTIARLTAADAENNYYQVDMSGLPGDFERAALLDLIFADKNLVVTKTDIGENKLELCAALAMDINSALCRIDDYYHKAAEAGNGLTPEQKKAKMEKYAKYRSK